MSKPLQAVFNIADICAQLGVERAVLSPGSRVAPLTLAFARHPQIKTYTISDERSAAFIAMGMAQQSKCPVVIACTSGTAALNYGPAIAEAFYQQVPLIVITADRPPEWVDQQDGQTIRQQGLHQNHTKGSYQLPVDHSHPDVLWHIERVAAEGLNLASSYPQGPTRYTFHRENRLDGNPTLSGLQSTTDLDKLNRLYEFFAQHMLQKILLDIGE